MHSLLNQYTPCINMLSMKEIDTIHYLYLWLPNILRLDGLQPQAMKDITIKFICSADELQMKPYAELLVQESG